MRIQFPVALELFTASLLYRHLLWRGSRCVSVAGVAFGTNVNFGAHTNRRSYMFVFAQSMASRESSPGAVGGTEHVYTRMTAPSSSATEVSETDKINFISRSCYLPLLPVRLPMLPLTLVTARSFREGWFVSSRAIFGCGHPRIFLAVLMVANETSN